MATPLRYQSQYVPTNFQAVGNLTNMLARDMAGRDQMFDSAVAAESAALAEMGAMPVESVNINERNQRIQGLQDRIEQLVQRRGGDYGAAAKDISRAIALERKDPFYEFARQQQEQSKAYRQMQRQLGQNFYANADPTQVGYASYLEDPSSLEFQATNLADLEKIAQAKGAEEATSMKQFINQAVPGYLREVGYDYGLATQKAAEDWLKQNPQFAGDIMSAYNIDDPNVRQRLEQSALTKLVGERDTRFVQDYGAVLSLKQQVEDDTNTPAIMGPSGTLYLQPGGVTKSTSPIINQQAVEAAKQAGLKGISSYDDLLSKANSFISTNKAADNVEEVVDSYLSSHPADRKKLDKAIGWDRSVVYGDIVTKALKGSKGTSADILKAKEILDGLTLELDKGIRVPKYNFKTMRANASDITTFSKIEGEFSDYLLDNINLLKPVLSEDEDFFKKLEQLDKPSDAELKVTDAAYDPKDGGYGTGFMFELSGKDKKGKSISALVALPRSSDSSMYLEQDVTRLLMQILPGFKELYLEDNLPQ